MNFKELSEFRESCRSFLDKDVDTELITEIITQATNAPSACNSQPWKFVVCTGETAKLIPDAIIRPELKINLWTPEVPVYIVLCETKAKLITGLDCESQRFAAFDIGAVTSSICFSAADLGLGTCILGTYDSEKLQNILDIPKDVVIHGLIALGYSKTETPRVKRRKDISEVLTFNKW